MVRFHADVDQFTSWIDRLEAAAGPRPEPANRIVPLNGGFDLQSAHMMTTGRWEYVSLAWSRSRADMVESARMRGLTL